MDVETEIASSFSSLQSGGNVKTAVRAFTSVLDRHSTGAGLSDEAHDIVLDCVDRVLAAEGNKHPFDKLYAFVASAAAARPRLLLGPLLRHLVSERLGVKDRVVRMRALGFIAATLKGLPAGASLDESDEAKADELFDSLVAAVCKRAVDKTVGVRLVAVQALVALQEDPKSKRKAPAEGSVGDGGEEEGEEEETTVEESPARAALLWALLNDGHKDVRLAAVTSLAVPSLLNAEEEAAAPSKAAAIRASVAGVISALETATTDACPKVRAAAYTKLGACTTLGSVPVSSRLRLAKRGLSDPSKAVRGAAVVAFAAWLRENQYDMAVLMESFGFPSGNDEDMSSAGAAGDDANAVALLEVERVCEALLCAIFSWVEGPPPSRTNESAASNAKAVTAASLSEEKLLVDDDDAAGGGNDEEGAGGSNNAAKQQAAEGDEQENEEAAEAAVGDLLQASTAITPFQLWQKTKQCIVATIPDASDTTASGALYWRVRAAWLQGGYLAPAETLGAAEPLASVEGGDETEDGKSKSSTSKAKANGKKSLSSAQGQQHKAPQKRKDRSAELDALSLPEPGLWADVLSGVAQQGLGVSLDLDCFAAAAAANTNSSSGNNSDDPRGLKRYLACIPSPQSLVAAAREMTTAQQQEPSASEVAFTFAFLRQWLILGQLLDHDDETGRGKAIAAVLQLLVHPGLTTKCRAGRERDGTDVASLATLLCRILACALGCSPGPVEAMGRSSSSFLSSFASTPSAAGAGGGAAAASMTASSSSYSLYLTLLGAAAVNLRTACHLLMGLPASASSFGEEVAIHAAQEKLAALRAEAEKTRQELEALCDEDHDNDDDGANASHEGAVRAAQRNVKDADAAVAAADAELTALLAKHNRTASSVSSSSSASSSSASAAEAASTVFGCLSRALIILGEAASGPLSPSSLVADSSSGFSSAVVPFAIHQAVFANSLHVGGLTTLRFSSAQGFAMHSECGLLVTAGVGTSKGMQQTVDSFGSLILPMLRAAAATGGTSGETAIDSALCEFAAFSPANFWTAAARACEAASRFALSQPTSTLCAAAFARATPLVARIALNRKAPASAVAAAARCIGDALQTTLPVEAPTSEEKAEKTVEEALAQLEASISATDSSSGDGGDAFASFTAYHLPAILLFVLRRTAFSSSSSTEDCGPVSASLSAAWALTQAFLTGRLALRATADGGSDASFAAKALPLVCHALARQAAGRLAAGASAGMSTEGTSSSSDERRLLQTKLSAALHALAARVHAPASASAGDCSPASLLLAAASAALTLHSQHPLVVLGGAGAASGDERAASLITAVGASSNSGGGVAMARPKRSAAHDARAKTAAVMSGEADYDDEEEDDGDDKVTKKKAAPKKKKADSDDEDDDGQEDDDGAVSGSDDEDEGFRKRTKRKGTAAKKAPAKKPAAGGKGKKTTKDGGAAADDDEEDAADEGDGSAAASKKKRKASLPSTDDDAVVPASLGPLFALLPVPAATWSQALGGAASLSAVEHGSSTSVCLAAAALFLSLSARASHHAAALKDGDEDGASSSAVAVTLPAALSSLYGPWATCSASPLTAPAFALAHLLAVASVHTIDASSAAGRGGGESRSFDAASLMHLLEENDAAALRSACASITAAGAQVSSLSKSLLSLAKTCLDPDGKVVAACDAINSAAGKKTCLGVLSLIEQAAAGTEGDAASSSVGHNASACPSAQAWLDGVAAAVAGARNN